MVQITVTFSAPLHHTCLMYSLKQTFNAMPHLNKRVIKVAGKGIVKDNFVTPPPMLRNPNAGVVVRRHNSLVEVSYWRERATIEYQESCSEQSIAEFVKAFITNYLALRYPFTQTTIEDGRVIENNSGKLMAEIA